MDEIKEKDTKITKVKITEIDHGKNEPTQSITQDTILEELNKQDLENANKEVLIIALEKLKNTQDIKNSDTVLKSIKSRFELIIESEKSIAKKVFEETNEDPEAKFEYQLSNDDKNILDTIDSLRKKRKEYFSNLEEQKQTNLNKKKTLLKELRELVDGKESATSIDSLKKIQESWKNTGPIPNQYNNELWSNYNALIDRFYNNRGIYYELKEFDRKKNLELKIKLCEQIENLDSQTNIMEAVKLLNDNHEKFKNIGPVPKEEQEGLWNRFKAASDNIYELRKKYYELVKAQELVDYEKKKKVIEKAKKIVEFNSEKIKEWNTKTKEAQAIQQEWEKIGHVPKELAQKTNKQFWDTLKQFFKNKNEFFKELEGLRKENLKKKQSLVNEAEKLKDNEDIKLTAQKYKDLQAKWKETGPVPEKYRNSVYEEFRKHCDYFFNRRKSEQDVKEKEYIENLDLKKTICNQLNDLTNASNIELEQIVKLIDKYASVGHVPRNNIKETHKLFDTTTNNVLNAKGLKEDDKAELSVRIQVSRYKNTPDGKQRTDKLSQTLRRKISTIESEISNGENNLSFFARSSNYEQLKADFDKKKEAATQEVSNLKKQITLIRKLS